TFSRTAASASARGSSRSGRRRRRTPISRTSRSGRTRSSGCSGSTTSRSGARAAARAIRRAVHSPWPPSGKRTNRTWRISGASTTPRRSVRRSASAFACTGTPGWAIPTSRRRLRPSRSGATAESMGRSTPRGSCATRCASSAARWRNRLRGGDAPGMDARSVVIHAAPIRSGDTRGVVVQVIGRRRVDASAAHLGGVDAGRRADRHRRTRVSSGISGGQCRPASSSGAFRARHPNPTESEGNESVRSILRRRGVSAALILLLVSTSVAGADAAPPHSDPAPYADAAPRYADAAPPYAHTSPLQGKSSIPPEPTPADIDRASRLRIDLITMGPGDAVWERFGHNALRVYDPLTGDDVTYNYGMFDFAAEDFFPRFFRGDMLYWMEGFDTRNVVYSYIASNRSVYSQELNLTPEQKARLVTFLEWNAREENRYYAYHYYRDNCSTRVRDAIDYALGGQLREALAGV